MPDLDFTLGIRELQENIGKKVFRNLYSQQCISTHPQCLVPRILDAFIQQFSLSYSLLLLENQAGKEAEEELGGAGTGGT